MTYNGAAMILRRHNRWRRGEEIEMQDPKLIGIAIDEVTSFFIKNMTYNEAADLLRSNNCPVFEGEMNPTLFGIRTSDEYTNAFTDFLGVLWTENGENKIAMVNGTTKPGLYGDGAITSPKWIHGIFGTAVMVPGHYKGLWKMVNFNLIDQGEGAPPKAAKSFNPWQYPYLHQVGKCRIWRDGDMDLKITKSVEVGL